ncbi:MAG: Rieske (2Fe-2S) protein [Planctomycetota bacterium]
MSWTTLCQVDELIEGNGKYVDIDGKPLAVFLHNGSPFVLDNLCPHAGGELADGWVEEDGGHACAICPLHAWPFRLDTGEMPDGGAAVRTYPARIDGAFVQADLSLKL